MEVVYLDSKSVLHLNMSICNLPYICLVSIPGWWAPGLVHYVPLIFLPRMVQDNDFLKIPIPSTFF